MKSLCTILTAFFGLKVEADGMDVVKKIYNCGEKPQQGQIQSKGNEYLDKSFPDLSRIVAATILPDGEL